MNKDNVKTEFDFNEYMYYRTKKGIYRKARIGTTDKSIIVTHQEFMNAWDNHYNLFYA